MMTDLLTVCNLALAMSYVNIAFASFSRWMQARRAAGKKTPTSNAISGTSAKKRKVPAIHSSKLSAGKSTRRVRRSK